MTLKLEKQIVEKWRATPTDYTGQLSDVNALVAQYTPVFHSFGIDNETKSAFIDNVLENSATTVPKGLQLAWLHLLRILFRDKECDDLDCFSIICRRLLDYARLAEPEIATPFDESLLMESEKVLSNLVFNSAHARATFVNVAAENILTRIRYLCARLSNETSDDMIDLYAELTALPYDTLRELYFFDLKIAFIVSAHATSLQKLWLEDTDKTIIFIDALAKATVELERDSSATVTSTRYQIAVQALNILYNIYCHAQVFDVEVAALCAHRCADVVNNVRCDFELKQMAVNVLALMPTALASLCPPQNGSNEKSEFIFEGCNIQFANNLLVLFEEAIDRLAKESSYLMMFFKALIGLCTSSKAARRYFRLKILPPLRAREVERPPEEGDALRNKMVRLMKGPSQSAQASAEFFYVLCKRSESRMMKYCGFGHAAGLFANRGLLGAAAVAHKSESDSEDSETDDYKNVEDKVNPITGYIPSKKHLEEVHRQLDSMTDKQKEYEAMKLANAMSKLMDEGVFVPATVGEDGRPCQVSHVAELIKDVKTEEKNSEDED